MACRVGSSPILLALLSLSGLPIAQAQQAQAQSGANKLALVVGIDDYADPGLSRLRYAAKDAADIASALRNLGFSVNALTGREATRSEILRAVRSLIERWVPMVWSWFIFQGMVSAWAGRNTSPPRIPNRMPQFGRR